MTVSPPFSSSRRRAGALAVVGVLIAALFATVAAAGTAGAVQRPEADAAAAWLASRVKPDGSALGNNDVASVNGSVSTALALAMTDTQGNALYRAVSYVRTHVESYVDEGSGDLAGRLGNLIILAHAVGDDPTSFGTPATDLVARLQASYESSEPGFYGTPNDFSATTDQSLAVIALVAAGATVPADAVQWLLDQQCTGGGAPTGTEGGWQGYRATTAGSIDDCIDPTDPDIGFGAADSNSTSIALQALAVAGDPTAETAGVAFLKALQVSSGAAAAGFEYQAGFGADPNSTALAIQTIVALGGSPTDGEWMAGGATAVDALRSFVITSGADAGALQSTFNPGVGDYLATYQGVWGFTETSFPFEAAGPLLSLPPGRPVGSLDVAAGGAGVIELAGWAIDPEVSSSIPVHVYVDGAGTAILADQARGDVAGAFPGYGDRHGYHATIPAAPGAHQVCAWGIDTGTDGNTLFGCRTVEVQGGQPFGTIDAATTRPGFVDLAGWSIDPDTSDPIQVHVYLDSAGVALVADDSRADVGAAFPGYGDRHGYHATIPATPGAHQLCAWGINAGVGGNALLGCRTVVVPGGSPIGTLDVAAGGAGAIELAGWAIDPDVTSSIPVHVYVDGAGTAILADQARGDVAGAFPAYGDRHGYATTIPATPGTHRVCAWGIDTGSDGNTLLGCRTVEVTAVTG